MHDEIFFKIHVFQIDVFHLKIKCLYPLCLQYHSYEKVFVIVISAIYEKYNFLELVEK